MKWGFFFVGGRMEFTAIAVGIFAIGAALIVVSEHLEIRHWFYFAILVLSLVFFGWLYDDTIRNHEGEMWRLGVFFGSILVTIGWIVTNEFSIRNSRKQHTITLITTYFTNAQRIEDKKVIHKYLPTYRSKLTAEIVRFDAESHELLVAIDRELNFFEFLAIGVNRNDLDEALLRDCMENILCNSYEQAQLYIAHWRGIDPTTWERLAALYAKWRPGTTRGN
jgi:hypothetical protein